MNTFCSFPLKLKYIYINLLHWRSPKSIVAWSCMQMEEGSKRSKLHQSELDRGLSSGKTHLERKKKISTVRLFFIYFFSPSTTGTKGLVRNGKLNRAKCRGILELGWSISLQQDNNLYKHQIYKKFEIKKFLPFSVTYCTYWVKVLKAMLQSGWTKTGSASSSCTLLGRVAVSRAVWLLIVCADKQAACDLWSAPPWKLESPEYVRL